MNDDYIIKLAHQIVLFRTSLFNEGADASFADFACEAYIRNVLFVSSMSKG